MYKNKIKYYNKKNVIPYKHNVDWTGDSFSKCIKWNKVWNNIQRKKRKKGEVKKMEKKEINFIERHEKGITLIALVIPI